VQIGTTFEALRLLRFALVETRRLRKVNIDEMRTRKMCALTIEKERATRKMYALEINRLLADERRKALPRTRHLSCDYQFAPLPRPMWMRSRRAQIFGVLAAVLSGLLVYWSL
jgi:hypothetical protein